MSIHCTFASGFPIGYRISTDGALTLVAGSGDEAARRWGATSKRRYGAMEVLCKCP